MTSVDFVSPSFLLSELLEGFVLDSAIVDLTGRVSGLAWDSRAVKARDLFFACNGENVHGKQFIRSAVAAGASAIVLETSDVSEAVLISQQYNGVPVIPVKDLTSQLGFIASRFYAEPSKKHTLIGITGTNGKTSISHLLAQCLDDVTHPCGVIGTMGAGLWGQLKNVENTTPGAIELQQWFYQLNRKQVKYVAMEVSSHGLAQGRTNGCAFDMAVFTNLTQDHLDYHGDMNAYGEVKTKLFTYEGLSSVVLNLDDPFSARVLESVSAGVDVIGISLNAKTKTQPNVNVIFGEVVSTDDSGMRISIKSSFGSGEVKTSLLGDFNVTNLLTVFACAMQLGFQFDEVYEKLAQLKAPGGRLEKFGGGNQPLVVVDYAHTPDALEKVLMTLKKQTAGTLFVLIGCGGDRDKSKRPKMGAVAETHADVVYLTNDNPRTESDKSIIDDILQGITKPEKIIIEFDRAKAISRLVRSAKTGDVVLIAGKGHEDYQIIGDRRFHFSDREQVVEILGEAA